MFMLPIITPFLPKANFIEAYEDLTAKTVYTFQDCQIGDYGSNATWQDGNQIGQGGSHQRQRGKRITAIFCHSENDTTGFDVTSINIGGVSMTQRADRGGSSTPLNSAVFTIPSRSLEDITNTDVEVTFSTEVNNCAIGIVQIEGCANHLASGSQTTSQTGNLDCQLGFAGQPGILIIGSTCVTGGGTERFAATAMGMGAVSQEPVILYERSNAEFDYAACYVVASASSSLTGSGNDRAGARCTWSGTGFCDAAYTAFQT